MDPHLIFMYSLIWPPALLPHVYGFCNNTSIKLVLFSILIYILYPGSSYKSPAIHFSSRCEQLPATKHMKRLSWKIQKCIYINDWSHTLVISLESARPTGSRDTSMSPHFSATANIVMQKRNLVLVLSVHYRFTFPYSKSKQSSQQRVIIPFSPSYSDFPQTSGTYPCMWLCLTPWPWTARSWYLGLACWW